MGKMKIKKANSGLIMGLLLVIFAVTMFIMSAPIIFGDLDKMAQENNVTTGEYATEYGMGQNQAEYFIILLMGIDFLLAAYLVLYVLTLLSF
jgi:putative exporter of polyketide antibiotics